MAASSFTPAEAQQRFCNSIISSRQSENAPFRITQPFHLLTGREFEALAQKEHGGERRVSFLDKKGRQCEIPLEWTDLAPEGAIIVLAAGKSCFRAADLLGLARHVRRSGNEV